MAKIFKKQMISLAVVFCAAAFTKACAKKNSPTSDSEVAWLASNSTSDALVEKALRSKMAFKINLLTNRATLYKDAVVVDQWNVASADVTGAYHNGEVQRTPTGIYTVDDFQLCPAWYPRQPINPATGRVVRNEVERASVFANHPSVYGPCGARNPLGRYVIWFNGAYGLHGNSNESILELPTANERRVSGGCIRNPNAKIQHVFHSILDTFEPLTAFKKQVVDMESRSMQSRWTLTKTGNGLDIRVVVGRWSSDPAVNSKLESPIGSAPPEKPKVAETQIRESAPAAIVPEVVKPNVEPPQALVVNPVKQYCNVGLVDPDSKIAPVYLTVPNPTASVSAFYRLGWPVSVHGEVQGMDFVKVSRGFIDKKFLTNCSAGT